MHMNHHPLEVETSRNSHMMQMGLALPLIGRPTQSARAYGLGDRAFDARTPPILLHKGRRALHLTTLDEGRMDLGRRQSQ